MKTVIEILFSWKKNTQVEQIKHCDREVICSIPRSTQYKFHITFTGSSLHILLKLVLIFSIGLLFHLSFFLGGPMGGICWLARALKASAMRWGWDTTICFQPAVSITSVTWRVLMNSIAWNTRRWEHWHKCKHLTGGETIKL